MSTHRSLVRFSIKGSYFACGYHVMRTQYEDIAIMKLTDPSGSLVKDYITKGLRKSEISLSAYITNRDDVLYHAIKELVRKELNRVVRDECL